jgi:hypothetical protein
MVEITMFNNRCSSNITANLRRHGTFSLSTQSGKVLGKTAARHTSQEFVESLTRWSDGRRRERSIECH